VPQAKEREVALQAQVAAACAAQREAEEALTAAEARAETELEAAQERVRAARAAAVEEEGLRAAAQITELKTSVANLQEQVRGLEVALEREREEGAEQQNAVAASAKARIDKVKDLVFTHTHTCTHTYVYTYIHTYIHIDQACTPRFRGILYIFMYIYVYLCIYMYIHMCVCVCVDQASSQGTATAKAQGGCKRSLFRARSCVSPAPV